MNSSSRTRNTSLNLITIFGQQMVSIIMRFIIRTMFIHTLGAEYLGINGVFGDVLDLLSLTEMGFDTAINFKLYKPLVERDEHTVRLYLKFYKQIYRIVSIVILTMGLLLIPVLPLLIKDYEKLAVLGINGVLIYILYLLRSVSSYLFFAYKSAVIKADQKLYLLNTASFFIDIALGIVQIIILLVWRDYILYTFAFIFFSILRNFIYAWIAEKRYPGFFIHEEESLPREEVRGLFKDCLALFVFKVDNAVLSATDNLVISAVLGLSVVGIYSNYLMFYTMIKGILSKVYVSVKASMGNLFAVGTEERKYFFFETMNFVTIILYGTAAVGIAVVSNELIDRWVGADYVYPQPLPVLIGIEMVFSGIRINLNQIRNISGVFRQMWYRPIMGIVINLVVSVAGVFLWGINGVVLGTICAAVFANFAVDPGLIHKYTFNGYEKPARYYRRNLGYLALLAVICAIDMWICSWFVTGRGYLSIVVHGLICGVSVPLVFWGVYHRTEECRYLVRTGQTLLRKLRSVV